MSDIAGHVVVDADAHMIETPEMWDSYIESAYRGRTPRLSYDEKGRMGILIGDTLVGRMGNELAGAPLQNPDVPLDEMSSMAGMGVRPGGYDAKARLADMDSEGIDKAVLFPTIAFYACESPDLDLDKAICRAYNNWLGDHCAEASDRLYGVTLLPLRDIDASIAELERCADKFGFRGAFFRPNPYGGRVIQATAYDRFWDCCQSLGVAIAIHEGISDTLQTLGRDRVENPALLHLFEHPFEQMAAFASVIMTGVLERFPRLNFAFLESGCEWLPYWLDRMDGHYKQWQRLFPAMRATPSEYFRRQCYVSCDPDESFVASVVRDVGDENLLWASDYPHSDGPFPGAVEMTLESMKEIPAASREKIMGSNPVRLFGLGA